MKTNEQRETEAILSLFEALKVKTQECADLQAKLNQAQEEIRSLQSQVYGGSTQ